MKRENIFMLHKYTIIGITFLILVVLGVWFGSSLYHSSKVSASSENTLYKYYKSIQVQKGDSLWSIAQEYNTHNTKTIKAYIKEIKQINNLDSSNIREGEYLTVPYNSYNKL